MIRSSAQGQEGDLLEPNPEEASIGSQQNGVLFTHDSSAILARVLPLHKMSICCRKQNDLGRRGVQPHAEDVTYPVSCSAALVRNGVDHSCILRAEYSS